MSTNVYNKHIWRTFTSLDPCTKEELPVVINCTNICSIKSSPTGKAILSMVNGDVILLTSSYSIACNEIEGTYY